MTDMHTNTEGHIHIRMKIASYRGELSNLLPSQEMEVRDSFNIGLKGSSCRWRCRLAMIIFKDVYLSVSSHSSAQFGVPSRAPPGLASGPVVTAGVARFCGGMQRWLFISPVV